MGVGTQYNLALCRTCDVYDHCFRIPRKDSMEYELHLNILNCNSVYGAGSLHLEITV